MQRRQLSEFLKGCRARIAPGDLGLPDPRRRRTPGLRREDVAALAGVSVTWYTWLEQGRDIKVSAQVLEKISATLRMSPDEREYLFALVQHRPAPRMTAQMQKATDTLKRMIDALDVPAQVLNLRWDVVAWNSLVARIFRDYSKLEPCQRNLLRILLTDPQYQQDPAEHEAIANRVLAKFRVDYSLAANDPDMNGLVAELNQTCPVFKRLWGRTEVSSRSVGINVVRHHHLGGITFEHSSYVPEGSPSLRVVIFVPHDEESRHKVSLLLDERGMPRAAKVN
jgi:transcriptional regulator with XRE-family HTH domain